MRGTLFERFWAKVGPKLETGCQEWQASLRHGYGQIWFDAVTGLVPAHRAAWFLAYGRWPAMGLDLRHRCHNPRCVAIDHLVEGTRSENLFDDIAVGKHRTLKRRKLTDEQVRFIRNSIAYGSNALARDFGISKAAVYQIQRRITYKEIPDLSNLPLQLLLRRRRRRSGGGGIPGPRLSRGEGARSANP